MSAAAAERFDPAWLALREPYDRRARSKALAEAFLRSLPRKARVADLACGGGANARYLAALGRRDLRWALIDADPDLLAAAGEGLGAGDARRIDLARPRRSLGFGRHDGVTASALCDLVSARWLEALIRDAACHGLPLLFALTVDGRVALSPGDAQDRAILGRFRRDQRRGKGFGPALGPHAPQRIAAALRRHGYRLQAARSDWRLGPADGPMLRALVSGIAEAAGPGEAEEWRRRRQEQIDARRLSAAVGHIDFFASLPRAGRKCSRSVTLP
ncbi:MAG: class I SAM-dependent methyltransferase [Alphaproteobacteria bacterium]|nr:class I SAM-dependent methyltransferase [Alphaproteobacteria bacterium]